ncbi:MAG: OmpP1/FadL family transporter [Mesorhizobium sp.]|jgi:long-chain fatty acid transport protein
MTIRHFKTLLGVGCAFVAMAGEANAGGFDRGGVNIDLLFDDKPYAAEAGVTYVAPQRKLENVRRMDGSGATSSRVDVDDNYAVPRLGFKANVFEPVDCLATFTQPYGADADYGINNAYSPTAVRFKVDTNDYGLTCSYKIQAGKGFARIIGGISYQEVDAFQSRQSLLATPLRNPGIGKFSLSDEAVAWRVGASYEIPEIALRASLVYSSKYDYDDLTGTVDTTGFAAGSTGRSMGRFLGVFPVSAATEIPQALEFKVQSGIAPGWLAFGGVKWQDWSQLQIIPINGVKSPVDGTTSATSFDPLYRDGWTVTAGVGHAFNEQLSGAFSISWDRGTSTVSGYQTDLWNFAAGGSYKPTEHIELRLGGSVGFWQGGTSTFGGGDLGNRVAYTFGDDIVTALSASVKVKF